MLRLSLWGFVLAMFVANSAFDIGAAHVAYRFTEKVASQDKWGDPTYYPWERSSGESVRRLKAHPVLLRLARRVFDARYALSALPLLVLLYFTWTRTRLTDAHLGLAIALGAFALAAKVHFWEMLLPVTDVYTAY